MNSLHYTANARYNLDSKFCPVRRDQNDIVPWSIFKVMTSVSSLGVRWSGPFVSLLLSVSVSVLFSPYM